MYRIINEISHVVGEKQICSNGIFLRKRDNTINLNLFLLNLEGETIWRSEEERVLGFCILNENKVIYNSRKEDCTIIRNLNTRLVYKIEEILYDLYPSSLNVYKNLYYNLSEIDNNIIYDLETGKINQKVENKIAGFIALITSELVITKKDATIYSYSRNDFSKVWQQDLSEKLNFIDAYGKAVSPRIRGVLQYKDNLIVYSAGGIASLHIQDGTLNWFTGAYATFLIIENNMGYAATKASIYRVNLETGELIDYEGLDYSRMPNIKYDNREYWPFCGKLVFYNGLLWRYSNAEGRSFIIAINPHDGHYEWVHCVDTNGEIVSIQFHQDKMFVSDTSDTLYIYQKEEIIN